MPDPESRVTIHLAASLDGFVARRDGRVDWLETEDAYERGAPLDDERVAQELGSIDGYVMGARTYETALAFEAEGRGWPYGDVPTVVLTHRDLPRPRPSVELRAGDLAAILRDVRARRRDVWVVGGPTLCGACLRLGLADEVRITILPILIGDGLPLVQALDRDVALHLVDEQAYRNGMVELRYAVRGR